MANQELSCDISGMSCTMCVGKLTKALKKMTGVDVKDVKVGKAVMHLKDDVAPADVAAVIAALGFTVTAMNAKTP